MPGELKQNWVVASRTRQMWVELLLLLQMIKVSLSHDTRRFLGELLLFSSDPFDHFSEFIIISPFQRYGSLNSSSATLRRRCYSYEEASWPAVSHSPFSKKDAHLQGGAGGPCIFKSPVGQHRQQCPPPLSCNKTNLPFQAKRTVKPPKKNWLHSTRICAIHEGLCWTVG